MQTCGSCGRIMGRGVGLTVCGDCVTELGLSQCPSMPRYEVSGGAPLEGSVGGYDGEDSDPWTHVCSECGDPLSDSEQRGGQGLCGSCEALVRLEEEYWENPD